MDMCTRGIFHHHSSLAGIPPPTPLFRGGGAKHFKTKTSPPWQKTPGSSQSSSSSSSSDEDESVKPLWVQCDHRNCQKWRKLPPGTKIDIEEYVLISSFPSLSLSPFLQYLFYTGIGIAVCTLTPPTSHVTPQRRNA